MKTRLLLVAAGLFCALALVMSKNKKPNHLELALYYWKTTLHADSSSRAFVKGLGIRTVYLRMMDIDKDPVFKAVPRAELTSFNAEDLPFMTPNSGVEIVPVFFLRNRIFQASNGLNPDSLALKVWRRLQSKSSPTLGDTLWPLGNFKTIQIDCDWTKETRDAYFNFLLKLKAISGKNIQVTLRLEPFTNPEMYGVPPADRAVLMAYNMEAVNKLGVQNAIFDLNILSKYLDKAPEKSLPLDLALPLFSWTVVNDLEKTKGILREFNPNSLGDYIKPAARKAEYTLVKDTVIDKIFLRAGDVLRQEGASLSDLEKAIKLCLPFLDPKSAHIGFFHLDNSCIERFPHEKLRKILDRAL